MSLTEHDRKRLENAVGEARRRLEEDYEAVLEGRYGIHRSGRIEDASRLALPTTEQSARGELVAFVEHLRSDGLGQDQAVARMLREAVFTTLNRLVAIRVAEAIDLLPESLARGRDSRGYREFLEVFPLLAKDATVGYWTFLRLCADELAHDAPVLFDPRNPLLALEPFPGVLDNLAAIFADGDLAPVWADSEAFGWAYQYFISTNERRAVREAPAPRNSQELAVRNQWFTPRYVVEFLVHNTLGRRLLEVSPDSALRKELHMLVDPSEGRGRPLDLQEVRVLDPAVGSGHFLLGCYDVLEKAWQEHGVSPADAAPRILLCLWGIDIDPRCAQVAAAALVLRARRRAKNVDLPRPNVFTARSLPTDPAAWRGALEDLGEDLRGLVRNIQDALKDAPILGSLLKVEETLRSEIRTYAERRAGGGPGTLFEHVALGEFAQAEAAILGALRRVAAEASSTPAERLLAAEATDAIGFVETMRGRYDAVLMNPPFGEPIPQTKTYLKATYPWIPWKDYNLLAAFVGRGIELLGDGGYLGAITSRAGLFLTTFERWRKEVLLAHRLITVADLGHGVMAGATVEAAAFVIGAETPTNGTPVTFLRLVKDTHRSAALAEACRDARDGETGGRIFRVTPEELEQIPGAPITWAGSSVRRLFTDLPALEGDGAEVRVGLQTSDDFRFVRVFWEVDPAKIARSREETLLGKRWVAFAKGGEYSPYHADIHLVVDWEEDGRRIREFEPAVVRNAQYYFRAGVTWPERTNSAFAPQACPAGTVFSVVGPLAIPVRGNDPYILLAWLSSRLVRWRIEVTAASAEETKTGGVPSRHYSVGLVSQLPWMSLESWQGAAAAREGVSTILKSLARVAALDQETSWAFTCPRILAADLVNGELVERIVASYDSLEETVLHVLRAHSDVGQLISPVVGVQDVEDLLEEVVGPDVWRYEHRQLEAHEEQAILRLVRGSLRETVEEATRTWGPARFIRLNYHLADRRLETICHAFRTHPEAVSAARRRNRVVPEEFFTTQGEDIISYLVGCALGRWDIRIGRDPTLAPPLPGPFDRVPTCSPGMLVGPDAFPAREAPPGYSLDLPSDRILLDEEGHPWDIELRVRRAAEAVLDDPEGILDECQRILGRELREHFRRDFFKVHLGRYSKSRRKAPIYWHLSVPTREWGLWVYAPSLTRETLFAVVREARRKESLLVQGIDRLRHQVAGASGRERQRLTKQLDTEEGLLREVRAFLREAERVANLGWVPELDDGIILCAAPLAGLMPAWRQTGREEENKNPSDPEQARRMIKAGKFPWATVSRFKEQL